MDSPFFKSRFRGVPVEPVQPKAKVVSIPVHFIGSETTRSASALKIQKVFRGFVVRKSVKKIDSIRREVEEIERRVSQGETVELIRRESKERLRLNETLMALLFKLDSVRGVNSGVRDFRKAVIKQAIALQERVDAIAAVNQTLEFEDLAEGDTLEAEGKESGIESSCSNLIDDGSSQASEIKKSVEVFADADKGDNRTLTLKVEEPDSKDEADAVNSRDYSENSVDESSEVHCSDEAEVAAETKDDEKMDVAEEVIVDVEANEDEEDCIVNQVVDDQHVTFPTSDVVEESVETNPTLFSLNPSVSVGVNDLEASERQEDGGERDDEKRKSELLERMIEDNEKMMSLMKQLYEKNEIQTQMLSSLAHRVEQLERAFICDRLRKKKKRHAFGIVPGSQSTPDQKKCEKR